MHSPDTITISVGSFLTKLLFFVLLPTLLKNSNYVFVAFNSPKYQTGWVINNLFGKYPMPVSVGTPADLT
jgi:hypothetical protein